MNIEDYIKNKDIDFVEPDIYKLWNGIESQRKSRKAKRMRIWRGAAAVMFIGLLIGTLIRHELTMQKQITSLSQINSQLAEKEQAYNLQVAAKWTKYSEMPGNESTIAPFLLNELKLLDTIYQDGLQNILEKGLNEREIILLLNTYEKRLRIIEQLIYEKEKQNKYENRNRKLDI